MTDGSILCNSGVSYPLAAEIGRQMTSGVGNPILLSALGLNTGPAIELARQISAGVFSADLLTAAMWNSITSRVLAGLGDSRGASVFRLGLNVSGMEDNGGVPSIANLSYIKRQGIKVIRLPTDWAKMQAAPGGPLVWGTIQDNENGATLTYDVALSTLLARCAALGMTVMIDLHNFGQDMTGAKIGQSGAATPAQFADFWRKFVTFLMADPHYSAVDSIDLMNEWNNMDLSGNPSTLTTQALVLNCNKLALAAVRGAGYLKRVYLEWDHFSGFWDAIANNVGQLMDLAVSDIDAVVMLHGYLDHDASGRFYVWATEIGQAGLAPPGIAVNVNIGIQRMQDVVALSRSKRCRLCHGEWGFSNDALTAGGNDDYADWNQAAFNLLTYSQQNGIESFLFADGPGFPTSYPYNPDPTSVSNPAIKDFTSTGLQSTQMVILQQFSGYTGSQPLAYRADLPFGVIPYAPPGTAIPNFKIRYNGVISATITFTGHANLADGTDVGGTFSSITLPPGNNGIATFSYTPAVAATGISLTFTNNRGLTDPPAIGISSATDFFIDNNLSAENIFWVSRLVADFVGKAYTIGRDADSSTMDVYFNKDGNLPRQAIQDFASSRSIKILKEYNQNANFEDIDYGAGPYPLLLLDDGTGYPSILRNNVGVNFSSGGSVGAGQLTVFAALFPTNSGIFLTEDVFVESGFRLTPTGNFTVARQAQPPLSAIGPIAVSSGMSLSTWALGQYTWSNVYGTNNLKSYLNGSANASANTVAFNFNPAFGQITLGTFRFGGPAYTGGQRGFVIGYQEASSAATTDFWNRYNTYYSTPLADSLSGINPLIAGAVPRNMVTGKTIAPFSGITISDNNPGSPVDAVIITLSGSGGGTLTGTGLSGSGPYTMTADTAANITTKLRALIYTPSGAAGTSETLSLMIGSSAGTSASSAATVVSIIAIAPAETPFAAPGGTFTPVNMKGVNISGGELTYPETNPSGFDYAYPSNQAIDYYAGKGMGVLRMPMHQLRLQPQNYSSLDPIGRTDEHPSSTFGSVYPQTVQNNLLELKRVVDRARSHNMYVILDNHFGIGAGVFDTTNNLNRYPGADSEATNILDDLIVRIVTKFKNYDNIIIDPMNEPVNMTAAQWITAANSVLAAISAVGPVSKTVALCGGGNFSGAHDWVSSGVSTAWASLSIPSGWTVYAQPHQYLDSDDSGSHSTVVAGKGSTVLAAFTTWARANSVQAILGEFGWSPNDSQPSGGVPSTEGAAIMAYMSANVDVWAGWTYWLGGSELFYGSYILASIPTGYPTGPFTDAPQMAIMVANLGSSSTKVLDADFIAGIYSPGPAASNDFVDTRASTQYVTDITGAVVTTIAPNTLAISSAGLLNEPAATNLMPHNDDMTNAAWSKTSVTVTANAGTAPDGTTTANLVVFTSGGSLTQTVSGLTIGNYYTYIAWVKANSAPAAAATQQGEFGFITGSSDANFNRHTSYADLVWEPHIVTFVATATSQSFGFIQSGNTNPMLIWRPTVVAGLLINRSITPSIIPTTTAAASRPANSITIQHTGIQSLRVYFADGAQQDITGINPAAQYTLPTTLNGTQIARIQGYSGSLPAENPRQLVSNRGAMPWNYFNPYSAPTEHVSYSYHTIGIATSDIQLIYTGRIDLGFGEVPDPSCPCSFEASLYFPTAPGTKQVKFTWNGGASAGAMAFNQARLMTDPLLPSAFGWTTSFPAGTNYHLTLQRKITSASSPYPYNVSYNALTPFGNGDAVASQNGTANFLDYTLAQGAGISGGTPNGLYLPLAIIGHPVTPDVSVAAYGDSLIESSNFSNNNTDQGGYNNLGGWFARGMTGVSNGGINGRIIPWTNTAIDGTSAPRMLSSFAARSAVMPFATHAMSDHLHNFSGSFLQFSSVLWLAAQSGTSAIRHFEQVLGMPDSTTTDGYLTYTNQTIANDWTTQNNQIIAAVGTVGAKGFPSDYFSHNNVMSGQAVGNPMLWIIGTSAYQYVATDNTHPTSAGIDLMVPDFITRTLTWT